MIDLPKLTALPIELETLSNSLLNATFYFKDMDRVCAFSKVESEDNLIESLSFLRKEVGDALLPALKDKAVQLNDHKMELELCLRILNQGANKPEQQGFIDSIVEDSIKDAETSIKDGNKLMGAFASYVRGTKNLLIRLKNLRIQ
jgi:hypothetical protein